MCESHLGDQRDEAMSVARWRAPGSPAPPWIAHRSCGWRRLHSVEDVGIDLVTGKIPEHVREVRTGETKQEGRGRGAGVVGIDRSFKLLPAVIVAARARA